MSEYVPDWDTAEFVCPECENSDEFFQNGSVAAWRNVDVTFIGEGLPPRLENYGKVELDYTDEFDPDRFIACTCGFEGYPDNLELKVEDKIGWDGHPMKKPHPNQERLAV